MRRHEQTVQIQIVKYLKFVCPEALCLHIPNEGKRSALGGYFQKAAGLYPGAADLLLLWPNGRYAMVEVKSSKGRLTDSQVEFGHRIKALGGNIGVARSIDDIRDLIREWGVPCREAY